MTQEEKFLLLKDLCARLAYEVKVKYWPDSSVWGKHISPETCLLTMDILTSVFKREYSKKACLPYLRPMSSMTEEEFFEYRRIKFSKVTYRDEYKRIDVGKYHNVGIIPIDEYLDWLNAHHFDYRGLIEKGLALEAPEGMYN